MLTTKRVVHVLYFSGPTEIGVRVRKPLTPWYQSISHTLAIFLFKPVFRIFASWDLLQHDTRS